jgi:hypothetical protein
MKLSAVIILLCLSLTVPLAYAQGIGRTSATAASPAIPEEARRHFVMGTALFKDAKTPDDFVQVESEFKLATDLAPQWPDARYNLALAKEAAGDFSGAMADLKLYQQFKLSDAEARTVQDKIYVLEARQKKQDDAARAVADTARAEARAAAQQAAVYQGLDGGVWQLYGIGHDSDRPWLQGSVRSRGFIEIHGHQIKMYIVDDLNPEIHPTWDITFAKRQFHADVKPGRGMSSDVTISGDGQSIVLVHEAEPRWYFHRVRASW